MLKRHRKAWMRLKRILKKVPAKKFDMGWWSEGFNPSKPNECGTSACAAGWATTSPWFRRRGLILNARGVLLDVTKLDRTFGDGDLFYSSQCTPKQFIKKIEQHLSNS